MHTDVLEALRAATAQKHALLDNGLPLGGPAPTLEDYRNHLLMLRAWLAPIAQWLDSFADGPRVAPARVPAIEADLLLTGPLPPLDDVPAWPIGASLAFRWGVCYVVEGSQLGGAVLYKKLADTLAPHPLGYLKGEGNPGPAWRAFIEALREEVRSAPEIEDSCRGACDAFDRLLKYVLVPPG